MDTKPSLDTQIRLLRIPEIKAQPAHRKVMAMGYIDRGADAALLLFWINLITGAYKHLPDAVVMTDVMSYLDRYPEFESDILHWWLTFDHLPKTL